MFPPFVQIRALVATASLRLQAIIIMMIIMIMIYNGKNGPEETTYIKQGVGLHIDMITFNGWCADGKGRGVGERGG